MRQPCLFTSLALLGLAGCASSDPSASSATNLPEPPAKFDFKMTRTSGFDVFASTGGAPLGGVLVQVRRAATPNGAGTVVWTSVTGPDGHARGDVRTERFGEESLDVTLNKQGYVGPWSDASARASMGGLAPSARVSASPNDLKELTVELEGNP